MSSSFQRRATANASKRILRRPSARSPRRSWRNSSDSIHRRRTRAALRCFDKMRATLIAAAGMFLAKRVPPEAISKETSMGNKVQGEGDYESARHYNDETRKFVDDKKKKGESLEG